MLVLLSSIIVLAIYLQALNYPFVSDDFTYLVNNQKLTELHWFQLWRLFTEPYNAMSEFLPLRELSYWFDMTLFGLNPPAFRLHNIVLYVICLPLVYVTTLSFWRNFTSSDMASAPWAAAAVTILFALHPSHVEAAVWISGRKDVLAGLFSIITLWFAVNAKRERGLYFPYAAATLIALLAACLSKATAVAVAPIVAMLWLMFWKSTPKHNRHYSWLLWALTSLLLAACVAIIFSQIITSKVPLYFGIEAVTRSLAVLGWLARLAVSPESRHFLYPVFEDVYFPAMVLLGVVILLASGMGVVMILRKHSLEGLLVVSFLLLCIPSIQLIPYTPPSLVSDRFVFLAVWPSMLLLVKLIWHLKCLPRIILFFFIALSYGGVSLERSRDWRSFETLVDIDFKTFPHYSMAAMYKSNDQLSQGLFLEAGETANNITIPEVRNIMAKLVKVHQAVTDSVSTGDSQHAMNTLLDYGIDLKKLPNQARWNTSLVIMWRVNRKYLESEWQYLVKRFPNDELLRNNARLALLNIMKYDEKVID
jgi:hypothetical protein